MKVGKRDFSLWFLNLQKFLKPCFHLSLWVTESRWMKVCKNWRSLNSFWSLYSILGFKAQGPLQHFSWKNIVLFSNLGNRFWLNMVRGSKKMKTELACAVCVLRTQQASVHVLAEEYCLFMFIKLPLPRCLPVSNQQLGLSYCSKKSSCLNTHKLLNTTQQPFVVFLRTV